MVTDESICPSLKCVTQCLLVQSSLKSLIFCPSLKYVTQCLLVQSPLKSLILSVFSDATKIRPICSLYYDLCKGKQQRQRTPRKKWSSTFISIHMLSSSLPSRKCWGFRGGKKSIQIQFFITDFHVQSAEQTSKCQTSWVWQIWKQGSQINRKKNVFFCKITPSCNCSNPMHLLYILCKKGQICMTDCILMKGFKQSLSLTQSLSLWCWGVKSIVRTYQLWQLWDQGGWQWLRSVVVHCLC